MNCDPANAGGKSAELLRGESEPGELASPVVLDEDVGLLRQGVGAGSGLRAVEVQERGPKADVCVVVDPGMLEFVVTIDLQNLGSLLGQCASDHRTGDRVSGAEDTDAAERACGQAEG